MTEARAICRRGHGQALADKRDAAHFEVGQHYTDGGSLAGFWSSAVVITHVDVEHGVVFTRQATRWELCKMRTRRLWNAIRYCSAVLRVFGW